MLECTEHAIQLRLVLRHVCASTGVYYSVVHVDVRATTWAAPRRKPSLHPKTLRFVVAKIWERD